MIRNGWRSSVSLNWRITLQWISEQNKLGGKRRRH